MAHKLTPRKQQQSHLPTALGTGVWQHMAVQGVTEGQHEVNDIPCWRIQQGTLRKWHLHTLDERQPERNMHHV